jgi:hypothetical protein
MPANFPVEPAEGWSFSGMMTPGDRLGLRQVHDLHDQHDGEEHLVGRAVRVRP